jgi:hypothetical protein
MLMAGTVSPAVSSVLKWDTMALARDGPMPLAAVSSAAVPAFSPKMEPRAAPSA